ncbi:hypothetical protein H8959_006240 [Pygathrix nigripes]
MPSLKYRDLQFRDSERAGAFRGPSEEGKAWLSSEILNARTSRTRPEQVALQALAWTLLPEAHAQDPAMASGTLMAEGQGCYLLSSVQAERDRAGAGLPGSKPDVISRLERGEEPRPEEREAWRVTCPDLETSSVTIQETPRKKSISEDSASPVEGPSRAVLADAQVGKPLACHYPLEDPRKQERHLMCLFATSKGDTSWERGLEDNELERSLWQASALIRKQRVPRGDRPRKWGRPWKSLKRQRTLGKMLPSGTDGSRRINGLSAICSSSTLGTPQRRMLVPYVEMVCSFVP